jgi:replicative DNA helicase
MHYLINKLNNLPAEEKKEIFKYLLKDVTASPTTTADQIAFTPMSDYTAKARQYAQNFGKMQGISSGYLSVDELTKGLVKGEVIVIAGKTSRGKTTLAMNIANNIALRDYKVLFVTMEMTKVQLTSRYIYINGGETEDYEKVATNTVYQLNDELDWKSIDGLIEHAKQQLNVDLVIIDHLHYFTREVDSRLAEDLGRITKELHKNAERHDVPIILISHVRKTDKSQEATMDDLRGSSYIAQDADIVLMVGMDEMEPNILHVKLEKNRNRGLNGIKDDNKKMLNFDKTKITEREINHPWNT